MGFPFDGPSMEGAAVPGDGCCGRAVSSPRSHRSSTCSVAARNRTISGRGMVFPLIWLFPSFTPFSSARWTMSICLNPCVCIAEFNRAANADVRSMAALRSGSMVAVSGSILYRGCRTEVQFMAAKVQYAEAWCLTGSLPQQPFQPLRHAVLVVRGTDLRSRRPQPAPGDWRWPRPRPYRTRAAWRCR